MTPADSEGRYIQPETLHAVVTLEHSVVRGEKFYATVTLPKTVSGWVGTCMRRVKINETVYAQLRDVILRLMVYYNLGIEGELLNARRFATNLFCDYSH